MIEELRTARGRRRWERVDGRVIDKRHLKDVLVRYDATSQLVSIDEYLVEIEGPDAAVKRIAVTRKSVHLPPGGVAIGHTVPLHVNRRRTKAVFGHVEPAESSRERHRRERKRRADDAARFKDKLNEA